MKVLFIAVGTKMPSWVAEGYEEFLKRLPKELSPKLIELPLAHRPKNFDVEQAKEQEAKAILSAIPPGFKKIILDVNGKAWSTQALATHIERWQMEGHNLAFVVGGPEGLSQGIIRAADAKWSLSNLTLPHPIVRIIFIEQLYRAWSILHNHPYHK